MPCMLAEVLRLTSLCTALCSLHAGLLVEQTLNAKHIFITVSTCLKYGRKSSVLKKVVGSERFLPVMTAASVANPSPAMSVSARWPQPCGVHGKPYVRMQKSRKVL